MNKIPLTPALSPKGERVKRERETLSRGERGKKNT